MGNLGSKKEGDIHQLSPNGLYTHCDWDVRVVRKLIAEKKLAPISLGREEAPEIGFEECPICFLHYAGGLNRSRCCKKGVCTECYLQVKRPHQHGCCPFCNREQYSTVFTGPLSRAEVDKERQEQQKVQQLKVQMRNDEIERDKAREKERSLRQFPSSPPSGAGASSPGSPLSSSSSLPSNFMYSPSLSSTNAPKNYSEDRGGASTSPTMVPSPYKSDSSFSQSPGDADLEEIMIREALRLSLLDPPSPAANHPQLRTEEPSPPQSPSTHPASTNISATHNQSQDSEANASEEDALSSAAGQDNEDEQEEARQEDEDEEEQLDDIRLEGGRNEDEVEIDLNESSNSDGDSGSGSEQEHTLTKKSAGLQRGREKEKEENIHVNSDSSSIE